MNNCRYEGFDHTFKEFWMGHKTTQTHYISRDPERHREEYGKAYENLRVHRPAREREVNGLRRELQTRDTKIEELQNAIQKIQPFIDFIKTFPDEETLKHFLNDLRNAKTVKLERKDGNEYHYFEIPDKTYERMRKAGFKNIDELIKYLLRKEEKKEKSQQKA